MYHRPMRVHDVVMGQGPDHEVIVIGAGFAGLCAGAKLSEAGIDYLILEATDGVGGTWNVNRYPGVGVDVPSIAYSYSFAQNPDWSRTFAPGSELVEYANRCADDFGVRPHLRFGARVHHAGFDDRERLWRIELEGGEELTSRYLVGAWGGLTTPSYPDIPGLADFEGTVMHTAEWSEDHDLTGERVAVIGTGASAVQVVPAIAPDVDRLRVFQRTATWVLPRLDIETPGILRLAFRTVPGLQRAIRFSTAAFSEFTLARVVTHGRRMQRSIAGFEKVGRWWIRHQVDDPALAEALTPRYGFGCKRPTMSNQYLRTFNRPNVELVTAPITKITRTGISTGDGRHHRVDTIVLGTGFKINQPGGTPPVAVSGPGGVDLGAHWYENGQSTYEGVSVPGFPNLFLTVGPYSLGGPSYIFMIEVAVTHIVRCLREGRRRDATRIEVRQEHHDSYLAEMKERLEDSAFAQPSCAGSNSYYFDHRGDTPVFRPSSSVEMWWHSRSYPVEAYRYDGPPSSDEDEALPATVRAEQSAVAAARS